jgi:hypothetical protein
MSKKKIICLKCGGELKRYSSSNEKGKFILRMKCNNHKCKAVFRMEGKSYADVMSRVLPVQEAMRRQRINHQRKSQAEQQKRTRMVEEAIQKGKESDGQA